jgi:hypothetical protein
MPRLRNPRPLGRGGCQWVAQWLTRPAVNRNHAGSNPVPVANRGIAQLEERLVLAQVVGSSNLSSPAASSQSGKLEKSRDTPLRIV